MSKNVKEFRAALLTLSDKGAAGLRDDESGRVARDMLVEFCEVAHYLLLPDEKDQISQQLVAWCDAKNIDLILTLGGTGLSPRDVTPEATQVVLERTLPGMAEAMRAASLSKTPHAMISRALVGTRGQTLIVNLPGSPKAVRENLAVLLPALPHALRKLKGDPEDCGSQ